MIDTHAHIFGEEFKEGKEEVIKRAKEAGIRQIWIPGIDSGCLPEMEEVYNRFPDFVRLFAGLHPEEVRPENYKEEILKIEKALQTGIYAGIGEIGLDLYWDKTYAKEQEDALIIQLDLALKYNMPVILHIRSAYDEIIPIIREYYGKGLKGVFHSYSGSYEQAVELTGEGGFLLGVNGSITFKKSEFATFLNKIPLSYIVTETDSPYMSPVPLRGRRNEPANIPLIVGFISKSYGVPEDVVKKQVFKNAMRLIE